MLPTKSAFQHFGYRKNFGGVNCIVVNPCDVPTTDKERKQKGDPLDSRKIAGVLKKKESLTPSTYRIRKINKIEAY
jgi:hypothetical protein